MDRNIKIDGIVIPIKVKKHWKNGIRYSICKKSVNLTMPKFLTKDAQEKEIEKLSNWAKSHFHNKPELLSSFRTRQYESGDEILIFDQTFVIEILKCDRKTGCAEIITSSHVLLKIPQILDDNEKNKMVGVLLSRVFSTHFINDIKERVFLYNKKYFGEKIESVRLKNNQSNWGSCSSQKNINLSSRLLFAPKKILDYVIIHELAHLKEMNHSPKYWSIVEKIMPDYRQYEKWLKVKGHELAF